MSMSVQRLEVGPLMANCYIVGCETTRHGFIVDPGGDAEIIAGAVREGGLAIDYIIDTHCHPDHTLASCQVRQELSSTQTEPVTLLCHELAREHIEQPPMHWLLVNIRAEPCPVDDTLGEGDELRVGQLRVKTMHLPGHSPGSIALLVEGAVFTGDVLMAGGIGRTDLPGGDYAQLQESLRRLMSELPDDAVVYPGHGPNSTIGAERDTNMWLAEL